MKTSKESLDAKQSKRTPRSLDSVNHNLRHLTGVLFAIGVAMLLTPRMNLAKTHKETHKAICAPEATGVIELTRSFQAEVLESKQPVVVDFYASWCPACKTMLPTFQQVGNNPAYAGKVKFVTVQLDGKHEKQANSAAQAYNVEAIPTVLFFNNGNIVQRHEGAMNQEALTKLIKKSFGL